MLVPNVNVSSLPEMSQFSYCLLLDVRSTALRTKNNNKKNEREQTIFIYPLWTRTEHTGKGNPAEKSGVMMTSKTTKTENNECFLFSSANKTSSFKYQNPRGLPMINHYLLFL